jgi:predicted ferric reductase
MRNTTRRQFVEPSPVEGIGQFQLDPLRPDDNPSGIYRQVWVDVG